MTIAPKAEGTLVLKRTFRASPSRVFEAWTSPDVMRLWFCPDETFSVAIAEVNLIVGGTFRVGMRRPDNEVRIATGTYREIKKPEKLVFTWSWEHDPIDTLITLTFRDLGNATEFELKHEFFPSVKQRDDHAKGWNGCLQQLERLILRSA